MHEWLFAIEVLLAAAICGAGILAPFKGHLPFVFLAAPLAGILLVPLAANFCYAISGTTYANSAIFSAALCTGLSCIMFRSIVGCRVIRWLPITLLAAAGVAVPLMDHATLRCGEPAILYMDGPDHGGYAQLADWLNSHRADQSPQATPDRVYESWPDEMFRRDPRFGSFGLLAIVSRLHRTSAIFTYDIAAAIVFAAACLGVAAVYATSWPLFLALAFGLATAQWFDDAIMGVLGKSIAYPSSLMLVGLVLGSLSAPSAARIFAIAILAAAVGIMHNGVAASLLIAPILLLALAAMKIRRAQVTQYALLLCGATMMIPAVASGLAARIAVLTYSDLGRRWSVILPNVLDLEAAVGKPDHPAVIGVSAAVLNVLIIAGIGLWAVALSMAIYRQSIRAISLLGGPLLLMGTFWIFGKRDPAYQLVGWPYPASLCGLCVLFSELSFEVDKIVVLIISIACVALRLPRAGAAALRYAYEANDAYTFTQGEMDRIAGQIGDNVATIDVTDKHAALFLLAETGRRQMNVQWAQDDWKMVAGYRNWPWQPPANPAKITIRPSQQHIPGHQFDVIKLP